MASKFIGLICGALTNRVYAVHNPDHDSELDNPRLLLIQNEEKEPVQMIKVERGKYMAALTPDHVQEIVDEHYRSLPSPPD
jgi:hypothetical protein